MSASPQRADQPPERGTERLHDGRRSVPGAVYFMTFVTAGRTPWLAAASAADAVLGAIRAWHTEGMGAVLAATVMPDHVHVLFTLGARLDVGRAVSRWKTVGRRLAGYPGEWQRDFWEHRVRDDESREAYGLYLFLNPYRASLVRNDQAWPWWWAPEEGAGMGISAHEARPCYGGRRFRFLDALDGNGVPPAEWVGWSTNRFGDLHTGE